MVEEIYMQRGQPNLQVEVLETLLFELLIATHKELDTLCWEQICITAQKVKYLEYFEGTLQLAFLCRILFRKA